VNDSQENDKLAGYSRNPLVRCVWRGGPSFACGIPGPCVVLTTAGSLLRPAWLPVGSPSPSSLAPLGLAKGTELAEFAWLQQAFPLPNSADPPSSRGEGGRRFEKREGWCATVSTAFARPATELLDMSPRLFDLPPRLLELALRLLDLPPRLPELPPRFFYLPPRSLDLPPRLLKPPPRLFDLPPRLLELPPRLLDVLPSLLDLPPRLLAEQRRQ